MPDATRHPRANTMNGKLKTSGVERRLRHSLDRRITMTVAIINSTTIPLTIDGSIELLSLNLNHY
jgi:hypothetical protein